MLKVQVHWRVPKSVGRLLKLPEGRAGKLVGERMKTELYHFKDDVKSDGPNKNMTGDYPSLWGDCSFIFGDCSDLRGDCTELRGECSNLFGDCSGLRGYCTNILGDCSGLKGNLDDIPLDKRPCDIKDYVEEE